MKSIATAITLLTFTWAALAQNPTPQGKLSVPAQSAWDQFQQQHGSGWQITVEPDTGYVSGVLGKSIAPSKPLRTEADFVAQAQTLIRNHHALFGVSAEHLQQSKFAKTDMAKLSIPDKYSVQFAQSYQYIPVEDSSFVVIFTQDGRCVDMSSHIIPNVEQVNLNQVLESADAQRFAVEEFFTRYQIAADSVSIPQLKIIATQVQGKQVPRLAWLVECRSEVIQEGLPLAEEFALAADSRQREVLRIKNLIHTSDLIGTITGKATPGTLPDKSSNPPVEVPLPNLRVTTTDGKTDDTNIFGDFLIPNVPGAINVSAGLNGSYAFVNVWNGTDSSVSAKLTPGIPQTLTFNKTPSEITTAEVNAFNWIINLRNWYQSIDLGFDPLGFQVIANVSYPGTCNAFYNGSSVNFYNAGGGCQNSAYSSIIVHELGHWINDRTGSGNGADGFGEGSADVWSMYILDNPYLGEDLFGPGTYVRSGFNSVLFCGDGKGGCHGEVHIDGLVLMGALWKVRDELKVTYDNSFAVALTNYLLVAWYRSYNDYRIHTDILKHWLVLSDDDGNLNNGTPYCMEIETGFTRQGFPPSGYCGAPVDPNNIYVDLNNSSGREDGSTTFPFNTITEGMNAAKVGGNVWIIQGNYKEAPLVNLNKKVTLRAANGSATIK